VRVAIFLACALGWLASGAEAQPVEGADEGSDGGPPSAADARQLVEVGDFEGAIAATEAALDTGSTGGASVARQEVARLLAVRALAFMALRDEPSIDVALGTLAHVDPDHRFDPTMPPDVVERFEVVRAQRPSLRLSRPIVEVSATGARIVVAEPSVATVPGLIRARRVVARQLPGDWRASDGGRLELTTATAPIEYYAELIGPGGVVLAQSGSAEAPHRWSPPAGRTAPSPAEVDEGGGWGWPVALGITGALAIAAVIVLVLVFTADRDSAPSFPMVRDR
jgi:hypothetical protein